MKKLSILGFFCFWLAQAVLPANLQAQNWTTVTATNITDLNQQKLAAGQLCFLATDQNDNPVSVGVGGGGQILKRGYCSSVAAGVVASFTVPNPANTLPGGIYYRVTVRDSSTGQEVLRYTQVSFTGATFNFDNYAPLNLGNFAPLSGNAVTGNLNITGNIAATGTVTASNIPSSILQQIFNASTGLTQRTALNFFSGITCADNVGTSRTDCRLGPLATVASSATPVFDCNNGNNFKNVLTANVTSSTLVNCAAGEPVAILIVENATGGFTFVPPTNVQGWLPINTAANANNLQVFLYDGTNAQPDLVAGLTGDVTSSPGSTATTVGKVNGVSFPSGPSTHSVPVITAANTSTWKVVPDCTDTSGNHLNYTQSTDSWSCGTSLTTQVVTLTGSQTLTNKTLNGATSGNSVVLLSSLKQDATAQLTGNAADQTIWTFSVPGGTIESGKGIDFDAWVSHDVGGATVTWKLTYGSAVVSCAVGGTSVTEIHFRAMIANNNGVTNAQRLAMDCVTTNTQNTGTATGAVDTTASQTLTFSFNVANTDKVTGHSLRPLKF